MDAHSDHRPDHTGCRDAGRDGAAASPGGRGPCGAPEVVCDLPPRIPVVAGEIAIIRAFLSDDIGAIIADDPPH